MTMTALPTGTVTFLFTDIEGSSRAQVAVWATKQGLLADRPQS
jgi:class 3 adenylate cyclase